MPGIFNLRGYSRPDPLDKTTGLARIHPLRSPAGNTVVTLSVAADWATGTAQSVFVGQQIAARQPDYTIHLGDTYYSGTAHEHADNFGTQPRGPGDTWPRGKMGSFVLTGNHEMFSSGQAYMDMINNPLRGFGETLPGGAFAGQDAPFFCLRSDHWCILCLDTGYDSLYQQWYKRFFNTHPNNPKLELPPLLMQWLETVVGLRNEKRGIIVLTHHQYITAFDDEDEFQEPARQLQTLLGPAREVIWISGHEHRFAMYNKYRQSSEYLTAYVRCIGNGGMVDEHTPKRILNTQKARSCGLELYDHRVADTFHFDLSAPLDIGYNCYVNLHLDGDKLELTFFAAYSSGAKNTIPYNKPMITEQWQADKTTGAITRLTITDHTIDAHGKSGLEYP